MHATKLIFTFLVSLICLSACDDDGTVGERTSVVFTEQDLAVLADDATVDSESCKLHCKKCPKSQPNCEQECFEVGDCGSECGFLGYCVAGYTWDFDACTCVIDGCGFTGFCDAGHVWDSEECNCVPDVGVPCGGAKCFNGMECCNAACQICAPAGGECSDIECGSPQR